MKALELLVQNYILNGLNNTLYSVYSAMNSAKEVWESYEKKVQNRGCWHK